MKLFKLLTRWFRWLPCGVPTLICLGLILWLTLAPHPVGEVEIPLFDGADKVVHAIMFWGLAMTAWFDAGRRGGEWHTLGRGMSLGVCLFALVIGALTEILQGTMGVGRALEWADGLADTAGVAIAYAGIMYWSRKTK